MAVKDITARLPCVVPDENSTILVGVSEGKRWPQ